jgi:hypothetical protein
MQHLCQQFGHHFIVMRTWSPWACFVVQTGEPTFHEPLLPVPKVGELLGASGSLLLGQSVR